jgi:hypothetical protein
MPIPDRPTLPKRFRRALFRFLIYGSLLVAGEVAFYTVVKVGRRLPGFLSWIFQFHWKVDPWLDLCHVWDAPVKVLYGQASLWMFLVYGSIALFGLEPAYHWMKGKGWPMPARGAVYMAIILAMECATGWILRALTGWDIWYYEDGALTILKYTSLAIAPMWFILGLVSENFIHVIDKLTRVKGELRARDAGGAAGPPL